MFLLGTGWLRSDLGNTLIWNFLPCLAQADTNFLFPEVNDCVMIIFAPESPNLPSYLSKFCVKQQGSKGPYKWAKAGPLVFSLSPSCAPLHVSCGVRGSCLHEFSFSGFFFFLSQQSGFKKTFRTSCQIPYTFKRSWPLLFLSANPFPHHFFIYSIWEGKFTLKIFKPPVREIQTECLFSGIKWGGTSISYFLICVV